VDVQSSEAARPGDIAEPFQAGANQRAAAVAVVEEA
jgi:hypothetical protein